MDLPKRPTPQVTAAKWPQHLLAALLVAVLVAVGGRLIASSADNDAIQHPIPEVQAILAKAAKLPLRDAAYLLWMEKSKLDKLERPEMTDEERAKARARSSEEITAAIRYEHDHAQDGATFDRLKLTHPQADTAEAKQAIIAGVKFNDACFKNFSHAPTDYDRRADRAIAVARNENPGYLPSTYRQARWWVTYLMK